MQNRIGQLEKLVVELMSNVSTAAVNVQQVPSTNGTNGSASTTAPLVVNELDVPEEPLELQLTDNFGRISLKNTSTSYVEADHWSAILDGVGSSLGLSDILLIYNLQIAELKEYFDTNTESTSGMSSRLYPPSDFHDDSIRDADGPSVIFGSHKIATKQEILAALPVKSVADRMVANFFANLEYGPGKHSNPYS